MTVATSVAKSGPYAGAGTTGPFTVGFRFLADSHLRVVKTDANGVDTTLVLNTDYSAAGAGALTGEVTLVSALATGQKLTILRNVPATQEADYVQNDAFPAESHETALDKLTMLVQQNSEGIDRSIKIGVADSPLTPLPGPASRANQLLGFGGTGDAVLFPITASVGAGDLKLDVFVGGTDFAAGTTTQLTLSRAPGTPDNLEIFFDGFFQGPEGWSVSGQIVTFTAAIPLGTTRVYARTGTTLSVSLPPTNSVGDAELQWIGILGRVTNSITALKALDKTSYDRAFVIGFASAGDGGGGAYWKRHDTAPGGWDNGGSQITANDGAGWELLGFGPLSVRQFGAKGDAVTDDTAAINATIAAVEARGGGKVYFPAVDYNAGKWFRCNGSILVSGTRDIELIGDGSTMIKSHAASTATNLVIAGDPLNLATRSAYVTFRNLRLWSATNTNGNGMRARKLTNLRVLDCSFFNHGLNGAWFSDCYTFKMERTESVGNNENGLRLTDAAGNNSAIIGCRFNDNNTAGLAGVRIEGLHYNVIIDKCDFEFNHFGVWADGAHVLSITQNYFELNNSAAVFVPPGSTARGVTLNENSVFSTLLDINSVAGVSLHGNVFEAGGTVANIGACTEVDIGPNSFPGGGSITTDDSGHTDFSAFGTWQAYTPAWTTGGVAPVLGNGTLQGFWKRIGKTCHIRIRFLAGGTTTFGTGAWFFSLPFTSVNVGQAEWYGTSKHNNGASTKLNAVVPVVVANVATVALLNAADGSAVTNTSPAAWAAADAFQINFTFETA